MTKATFAFVDKHQGKPFAAPDGFPVTVKIKKFDIQEEPHEKTIT
ncbi:hypothetical protein [Methylomonas sp. CM2]